MKIRFVWIISLAAAILAACGQNPPSTGSPAGISNTPTVPADGAVGISGPGATTEAAPTTVAETPLPTATPEPFSGEGPWLVSFVTADGVTLQGTLYGTGAAAVILAPMYLGTQASWQPFAEDAAAQGYHVLTFDYRGYGGSGGDRSPSAAPADVAAAVAFMRENHFSPVVLIGAELGGSASILAAAQDSDIAGLAVLSAPRAFPPDASDTLQVSDADLAALTMPTLWIATRQDLRQNVEEMQALAGGSDKEIWIYEGSAVSGTFIFDGADGPDLTRRLLEFIARVSAAPQ